jgi:hypothetical protein
MFLLDASLGSGRKGGREKFVAVDARRNASAAVVRLDSNNLREAADIDIAGHGNLSWQGKNEFDGTSRLKIGVDQKIETAETDVSRLALPFDPALRPVGPDFKRKRHRKSPRGSAFGRIGHHYPCQWAVQVQFTVASRPQNRNEKPMASEYRTSFLGLVVFVPRRTFVV